MKYGIIGSRKRSDKQNIVDLINSLNTSDVVISGGCEGPDLWAEEAARAKGINTKIFLPDLQIDKKSPRYKYKKIDAYYARNRLIAENSDIIHAFVAPERKGGTEYTIKYAHKIGIPVIIHNP
jgi:predicted Rossmann fold nucleotide-binding protein DprA/Smf involved in DNA uptake